MGLRRGGRGGRLPGSTAAALGVFVAAFAFGSGTAAAAPLSAERAPVAIDSAYGSGSFGRWGVDGDGLPRYRYSIDEATAPQAAQPELNGNRDAWHQLLSLIHI